MASMQCCGWIWDPSHDLGHFRLRRWPGTFRRAGPWAQAPDAAHHATSLSRTAPTGAHAGAAQVGEIDRGFRLRPRAATRRGLDRVHDNRRALAGRFAGSHLVGGSLAAQPPPGPRTGLTTVTVLQSCLFSEAWLYPFSGDLACCFYPCKTG
jgi:hypothetical protein